jgi:hypothetical protein
VFQDEVNAVVGEQKRAGWVKSGLNGFVVVFIPVSELILAVAGQTT